MTAKEQHRSRFETLTRFLFTDWDPIQVNYNENLYEEYQSFVPGVIRLIDRGCSVEEMAEHLLHLEREIGVETSPAKRIEVATRLLQI